MAEKLTLTNSLYLECVSLTSSTAANTAYTMVSTDSTYDRRIYGINVTNTTSVNHLQCTLSLSDGTTNYQMGKIDLPANAGNSISISPLDVYTNALFKGLLTYSMSDNMGVFYFNIPKGWHLKFTYTNTISAGQAITITTFGEKYGGYSLMHTSEVFDKTTQVVNATGTAVFDILTTSANDRRIYGFAATSTDATARTLTVRLHDGTNSYLIHTMSILANSGNSTTVGIDDIFYDSYTAGLFARTADSEGLCYYFNLPAGWKLTGQLAVATSATINIKVFGETYG